MRKIRWKDLATLPFRLCVLFLVVLGKLCGLTYKQISVVFNLWFQGAILMLSGMAPAAAAIYKMVTEEVSLTWVLVTIFLLVYASVYIYGFIKMLRHYRLPFNDSFDLCVKDLQNLAKRWRTTYQVVNLLIFIVLFVILIGLNLILAYYIIHL